MTIIDGCQPKFKPGDIVVIDPNNSIGVIVSVENKDKIRVMYTNNIGMVTISRNTQNELYKLYRIN